MTLGYFPTEMGSVAPPLFYLQNDSLDLIDFFPHFEMYYLTRQYM